MTLGEQLLMTAYANMFYITIDYKNKTNMWSGLYRTYNYLVFKEKKYCI